jgi:hypothetical protein
MKKILHIISSILPHISLILSVVFITFLILDQFNPMMNFVNNDTSMKLLVLLCFVTIINSITMIVKKT